MTEEPQFFPDGSSIWPIEGGDGYVAFADTGEPIGAVDADGDPIDHAEFVHPDLEDDDDLEYDDAVADLEEFAATFDPAAQIEEARAMGQQASGAFAEQAWADNIGRELRNLEVELQRPLTQTETWRILEEAHGDYQAGGTADFSEAVERAGLTPFVPGDDTGETEHEHAEGRRAYMRALVEDAERTARDELPDAQPARQAEFYDLDTSDGGHTGRAQLMADYLNGHDVEDRAFHSNEQED